MFQNRVLSTLAMLLVSSAMLLSTALAAPKVGKPAPDFTATDSNGQTHKLSEQRGSIVVLEWTNPQCPFVGKHYGTGNMQALQKEATGKGVVWWSINSAAPGNDGYVTPEQANELTKSRNAAPSAVLLDKQGKIGRLYGASNTPHMFVIDPKGTLVYMGAIDDQPSTDWPDVQIANNYVRAALNALQNGQAVKPSITEPYGCSVKY